MPHSIDWTSLPYELNSSRFLERGVRFGTFASDRIATTGGYQELTSFLDKTLPG